MIANVSGPEAREKVEKDLEDRYGPVPAEVRNLLDYSGLKTSAEKLGIENIDRRHNVLNVKFHQETRVDAARLMQLVSQMQGAQFTPAGVLRVPMDGATDPPAVLRFVREHLMEPLGAA